MRRLADVIWLVALGVFVFSIAPTFHGDEAMFISMSRDYATAFIDHNPSALMTEPPYPVDSDQTLRLINGTVDRYTIGLSWQIAGLTVNDLPPRPGWEWALDYDSNLSGGFVPSSAMLAAARVPSMLFLALSIAVMFALGWQLGGRRVAYFVSGLYAINPIVLLNGRRALQEGSLLFFGLLMILMAVLISKQRRCKQRGEGKATPRALQAALWGGLIAAGGLALASKQSGIVFVAGALGWIFAAEVVRWRWRDLLRMTLALIVAAGLIAVVFVALSPALWNDPAARIVDLLHIRADLLASQVKAEPDAPTTLAQRVEGVITQPFMTPPQHFEATFWANFKPITDEIRRYMSSPLSGLQFGLILGGALTLLAGVGIVGSVRRDWKVGVLVWLLVTAASLIANPLPWQRYSLPLIPVMTLLAGIGLEGVLRRFVWKPEQAQALSYGASQSS